MSSLAVAGFTAAWGARRSRELATFQRDAAEELNRLDHHLTREDKEEERRFQAAAELTRYRRPLLDAAYELGARIDNIRNDEFLLYLSTHGPRRQNAVLSTLYRLARYFGTLELLYSRVSFLEFEDTEDTKAVADLLAEIGRGFATDGFDWTEGFATSRFMIWREEQRAIGEIATRGLPRGAVATVGYATFVANYHDGDSMWFQSFVSDLEQGDAASSERLAHLQAKLAELVLLLDTEGRYTGKAWITGARKRECP